MKVKMLMILVCLFAVTPLAFGVEVTELGQLRVEGRDCELQGAKSEEFYVSAINKEKKESNAQSVGGQ